jgi:cell pole-organizing protein PopZ
MDEILASIRRILAEDAAAPPPPRSRAVADVLDLTEAVNDDGSVRHIEPPGRLSAGGPIPPLPGGRVEPAVSRSEVAPGAARLVSDAASDAVAASFARLAGLAQEARRDGERDLDALVQQTLRPLLQAWLDEHLPSLVERLVRDEIARVVGQSGPSAS